VIRGRDPGKMEKNRNLEGTGAGVQRKEKKMVRPPGHTAGTNPPMERRKVPHAMYWGNKEGTGKARRGTKGSTKARPHETVQRSKN